MTGTSTGTAVDGGHRWPGLSLRKGEESTSAQFRAQWAFVFLFFFV